MPSPKPTPKPTPTATPTAAPARRAPATADPGAATAPADIAANGEDVDPRIERSRAAVVAAAAGLLLDEGPDAITHGRVAATADVSRTTVYRHYPDRSDLLHATLEEIGKAAPQPSDFTGDFRRDLRMVLGLLAEDLRDDGRAKLIATMLERAQHDDAVATVRDRVYADFRAAFGELMRMGVEREAIRADVDRDRALASLAGALLFSKFLVDRQIDDELLDALIDDFLAAHRPPPPTPGG